jgi:endo-1,3-1,4-beta-glycanase ExoK
LDKLGNPNRPAFERRMRAIFASSLCFLAASFVPRAALAVKSGELYTEASHPFGRFEASIKFPQGDGVVGAFFLWKAGSEVSGTFWNELDFEKVGADCQLESNAFYGNPAAVHAQRHTPSTLLCGSYHTYAFEWTPDYVAWFVDGMQLRRDTGATAAAYADNAMAGMQYRFNIWPGDASFGGNFNPSILPVYEEIDWVQYSSYANGTFTVVWRDDFNGGSLDPRWLLGNWDSPKGLSQHDPRNVGVTNGHAILALTSDENVGQGVPPPQGGTGGMGGAAGLGGAGAGNAGGAMSGGAGGLNAGGASGSVSAGTSGAGGSGDAGGPPSGGASGAGGVGAAGDSGGAVSGGASGAGSAGGSASGGANDAGGAGNVGGSANVGGSVPGGTGGAAASGAPGSGAAGGAAPGGAGDSNAGGSVARSASPSSEGGCATSPGRPSRSGAWVAFLALTTLGAFGARRSRRRAGLPR